MRPVYRKRVDPSTLSKEQRLLWELKALAAVYVESGDETLLKDIARRRAHVRRSYGVTVDWVHSDGVRRTHPERKPEA